MSVDKSGAIFAQKRDPLQLSLIPAPNHKALRAWLQPVP